MKELKVIISILFTKGFVRLSLTAMQTAVTLAVLVSSISAVAYFSSVVLGDNGVSEERVLAVILERIDQSNESPGKDYSYQYRNQFERIKKSLISLEGVTDVSVVNGFPFSDEVIDDRVKTNQDSTFSERVTVYNGSSEFIEVLGVDLIAGRNFYAEEFSWKEVVEVGEDYPLIFSNPTIIISKDLANRMFPDTNPLNKQLYLMGGRAFTIIGVVDVLPGSNPRRVNDSSYSVLMAGAPAVPKTKFMVRMDSDADRSVKSRVMDAVDSSYTGKKIVSVRTLEEIKNNTIREVVGMLVILILVSVLLVLVTGLGYYGQTSFSIKKRTGEIGIKRAIGASRPYIIGYFLTETAVIMAIGTAVGIAFSIALNILFVNGMGMPKLDVGITVACITFMWFIGFIAVIRPTVWAAGIAPSIATKI